MPDRLPPRSVRRSWQRILGLGIALIALLVAISTAFAWKFGTPGSEPGFDKPGSLTARIGDTLIFTDSASGAFATNLTGERIWSRDFTPLAWTNTSLVGTSSHHNVTAVDPEDGSLLWRRAGTARTRLIGFTDDTIAVNDGQTTHGLDIRTGQLRWTIKRPLATGILDGRPARFTRPTTTLLDVRTTEDPRITRLINLDTARATRLGEPIRPFNATVVAGTLVTTDGPDTDVLDARNGNELNTISQLPANTVGGDEKRIWATIRGDYRRIMVIDPGTGDHTLSTPPSGWEIRGLPEAQFTREAFWIPVQNSQDEQALWRAGSSTLLPLGPRTEVDSIDTNGTWTAAVRAESLFGLSRGQLTVIDPAGNQHGPFIVPAGQSTTVVNGAIATSDRVIPIP